MAKAASNVANLHDREGKRRDSAMTNATHQIEAIFWTVIALVQVERGEIPAWPNFDSSLLPEIIRALAIRGRELNIAMMGGRLNELPTDELESVVFRG